MKHLLSLLDTDSASAVGLMDTALDVKKNPGKYLEALKGKTLLMIFEKPSLRTRLSFEAGMTQMGGHAIFLDVKDAPIGEKESIEDTAKAAGRYCDIVMARLFKQEQLEKLAENSPVPVINGLTDMFHPCQILSDLLTIREKKGKLKGLKLCFLGDGNNNVTHSLLLGCAIAGISISVGCPKEHMPQQQVVKAALEKAKKSGSKIEVLNDARKAAKDADIVYADSWMSYHVPKDKKEERVRAFKPFQVNSAMMALAKKDAIFMNCLPAMRGYEQTAEVIDGKQSIVFDQAENRLHMQKAIILKLLGIE